MMDAHSTRQEDIAKMCQTLFPVAREVVEVVLLLPLKQFLALEVIASQLSLTVGQLLRRTVNEGLPQVALANQPDMSAVS